jgi:hypothetical protein
MKHSFSSSAIFSLLLVLLFFCYTIAEVSAASFINSQIVASVGDRGTQSSLALDSKGNPHICYTYSNLTDSYLMYASLSGSEFTIEPVDTNGGANPSIALDSNDNPHVSYTYSTAEGVYLMYGSRAGSNWTLQTVQFTQNGSGVLEPSLRIDPNGVPHIGYVGAADTLNYAVWTDSSWKIEIIDPWTEQVVNPSLALDSDGKPWLSYYDPAVGLKCVSWTGSGWNKMIVDSAQGVGRESSLALDSNGNPHISYDDDPNGNLKYASWTGSIWNIQIVVKNKHISFHSSLVLDSKGNPHISYEDNANGNLMYASWIGSMWNLQIADSIRIAPGDLGVWGFSTSLALDATGTAHISYCGYTRNDLKYASISDSPSFLVTFKLAGVEGFEGKVLEVDSVDLSIGDLPKSFVWRAGSSHNFTFVSALKLISGDKLLWASTSGLSTSKSDILTISKEGFVSANYEVSTSNPHKSIPLLNYVAGSVIIAGVITAILIVFTLRKKKLK